MLYNEHIIPIAKIVVDLQIETDMKQMFANLDMEDLIVSRVFEATGNKFDSTQVDDVVSRLKELGSLKVESLL